MVVISYQPFYSCFTISKNIFCMLTSTYMCRLSRQSMLAVVQWDEHSHTVVFHCKCRYVSVCCMFVMTSASWACFACVCFCSNLSWVFLNTSLLILQLRTPAVVCNLHTRSWLSPLHHISRDQTSIPCRVISVTSMFSSRIELQVLESLSAVLSFCLSLICRLFLCLQFITWIVPHTCLAVNFTVSFLDLHKPPPQPSCSTHCQPSGLTRFNIHIPNKYSPCYSNLPCPGLLLGSSTRQIMTVSVI